MLDRMPEVYVPKGSPIYVPTGVKREAVKTEREPRRESAAQPKQTEPEATAPSRKRKRGRSGGSGPKREKVRAKAPSESRRHRRGRSDNEPVRRERRDRRTEGARSRHDTPPKRAPREEPRSTARAPRPDARSPRAIATPTQPTVYLAPGLTPGTPSVTRGVAATGSSFTVYPTPPTAPSSAPATIPPAPGTATPPGRTPPNSLWGAPPIARTPVRGEVPNWSALRDRLQYNYDQYTEEERPEGLPGGVQVPPEIFAMAEEAATHWDMSVSSWTLAASKPEKGWGAIWKIETDRGPRSIKLLHRAIPRSLFSVAAQDYLVGQGARVPPLVRTKTNQFYSVLGERMFIVTDWVVGLTPAPSDAGGAAALCYGLGEFQVKSRGYVPPSDAYFATRLHRWPGAYTKLRGKLDWFVELAQAYPEMPASPVLLDTIGMFQEQANRAIAMLENGPYQKLTARGEQAWGLVHQDYGWSNGQLGPGGVWVIDLDGVAFDLGIRDLRKLITGTMDDRGDWDVPFMQSMIDAYHASNPMEPELLQVMLTDMSLPNEFYKLVKEIVYNPAMLDAPMAQLIARCAEAQPRKEEALMALGWQRR